eukprot:3189400-Pleurochrysis_carterae.AAC.4
MQTQAATSRLVQNMRSCAHTRAYAHMRAWQLGAGRFWHRKGSPTHARRQLDQFSVLRTVAQSRTRVHLERDR